MGREADSTQLSGAARTFALRLHTGTTRARVRMDRKRADRNVNELTEIIPDRRTEQSGARTEKRVRRHYWPFYRLLYKNGSGTRPTR